MNSFNEVKAFLKIGLGVLYKGPGSLTLVHANKRLLFGDILNYIKQNRYVSNKRYLIGYLEWETEGVVLSLNDTGVAG